MLPDDVNRLVWISDPRLSPDATRVAYVVNGVDADRNRYRARIWTVDVDGRTPPRPASAGQDLDTSPRWAPDGRSLAWVSTRPDGADHHAEVVLLATTGPAERTVIAHHDDAVSGLVFSPDGRWLAYAARTRGPHYDETDVDRRPPRRVDRLFAMADDEGWVIDRPWHVYVVPAGGGGDPIDLTPGPVDHDEASWFTDSRRLAACVTNQPDHPLASDIHVIHLDGSGAQPITVGGRYFSPSVSPDGEAIAVIGHDDPGVHPQNSYVGILGEGDATPAWVSSDLDRSWDTFPHAQPPTWEPGGSLLATVQDRGGVHLYRLAAGHAPRLVVGGERTVTGWSTAAGSLAVVASTTDRPAELYVRRGDDLSRVTEVTDPFVTRAQPQAAERFTAGSGSEEVDAWLFTPPDFDPGRRYPMLLDIHGGPFSQYGDVFFDEAQLQARAGFVVLLSNPRGGSGRTEAWAQAILPPEHHRPGQGWGSVDYEDLMAVVDTALARYPFVDPDRLGVLGGSYGGYMTSWIVAHTNRFRAACCERGVSNLLNLALHSDIAGELTAWFGPSPFENPAMYMRMSPITHVDAIETPLLLLHSDEDLRCPPSQADELFLALHRRGHPVEYHRFPGESHELSRSGSPAHRVQRAELILDFFTRHLQP